MTIADQLADKQTELWRDGEADTQLYRDLIGLSIRLARHPEQEREVADAFAALMPPRGG